MKDVCNIYCNFSDSHFQRTHMFSNVYKNRSLIVLTDNKYIFLYNTRRISADLTFIRSLVVFGRRLDFQLPIVGILKFDFVASIAAVRLQTDSQQL